MTCPFSAAPRCSESSASCEIEPAENPEGCSRLYGARFWHAYAASLLVSVAYSILFRYADFVTVLGGTELQLGWIVGAGMVGSVLARLSLGAAIDQRGPKLIWLGSMAVFAATCFAHLTVTRCDGLPVYLLRFVYCTSLAGVFGAATTFVSGQINAARMAELVGIFGTSGFVGMMLGTHLGDLIAGDGPIERWLVDRMFLTAGSLALVAMPFAWLSTRNSRAPAPHSRANTFAILRTYHPGFVLAIGVAAGGALSLPQTFLRTYAADLNIPRIGMFFTVVAATAVAARVLNRRLPDRFGLSTMIFVGLGLLALAQGLFLVIRSEWQLILPCLPYGVGQAILYPMVAALGTATFPLRYRGLGITIVLASFDVGQLLAAPAAGGILHVSEMVGLAGYPTLFAATGVMLVTVGAIYAWTLQRRPTAAPVLGDQPVILRFPRMGAEHVASAPVRRPERVAAVASRAVTSRLPSDSSRSTVAARR